MEQTTEHTASFQVDPDEKEELKGAVGPEELVVTTELAPLLENPELEVVTNFPTNEEVIYGLRQQLDDAHIELQEADARVQRERAGARRRSVSPDINVANYRVQRQLDLAQSGLREADLRAQRFAKEAATQARKEADRWTMLIQGLKEQNEALLRQLEESRKLILGLETRLARMEVRQASTPRETPVALQPAVHFTTERGGDRPAPPAGTHEGRTDWRLGYRVEATGPPLGGPDPEPVITQGLSPIGTGAVGALTPPFTPGGTAPVMLGPGAMGPVLNGRELGLSMENGQLRAQGIPVMVPGLNLGAASRCPGDESSDEWRPTPAVGFSRNRSRQSTHSRSQPGRENRSGTHEPSGQSSVWPRRKMKEPLKFDGVDLDFPSWLIHFEAYARYQDWDQEEKALNLVLNLKAPATRTIRGLKQQQMADYEFLCHKLQERFDPSKQEAAYKVQLKGRLRKKNETPVQYADELGVLCRKAYPELPEIALEQLTLDQFISGQERKTRKHTLLQRPEKVAEAVTMVAIYESVVDKVPKVVNAISPEPLMIAKTVAEAVAAAMAPMMERIAAFFKGKTVENRQKVRPRGEQPPKGARKDQPGRVAPKVEGEKKKFVPRCYHCHELGHLARDCPLKAAMQIEADARSRSRNEQSDGGSQTSRRSESSAGSRGNG